MKRTNYETASFPQNLSQIEGILSDPHFDDIPNGDKRLLLALLGTAESGPITTAGLGVLARCLERNLLVRPLQTFQQTHH